MNYDMARLTEDEEKKIQEIENELNVILIAYDQEKKDTIET